MLLVKGDNDLYGSLPGALSDIDPNWERRNGVIVCGSHVSEKLDEKLEAIRYAREHKIPFLGICFGLHLMAIEYARNVLKLAADSEELNPFCIHKVVRKLPNLRVGIRTVEGQSESHWHNYEISPEFYGDFADFRITKADDGVIEVMRLANHPFFVGVQYHPEYREKHPILREFLSRCL